MMSNKVVRRFRCVEWQQSIFKLGNLMYFNELISVDYRTDFDFELHLLVCLAVIDGRFNSPNLSLVKPSSAVSAAIRSWSGDLQSAWPLWDPFSCLLRSPNFAAQNSHVILQHWTQGSAQQVTAMLALRTSHTTPKQNGGFFDGRCWFSLVGDLLAPSTSRYWIH